MAFLDPLYALPRTQKVILGLVPLVAIGALGWFLLLDPTIQERDGLRQRHEALRAEVIKARADEANLRPFRAQAEALRRRLEVARQRLPDEKEIPRLYRTLTDLAFQAGLAVALFQPRNPEDRAAYSEVPIGVTVEGTYHQVGEFLERVSRLPRLVTLGDFRMTGVERPTGTLRGEMTMATYIYRPEAAPRPGAPARPGTPPAGGTR